MKNADAPGALALASVTVANQTPEPSTKIEEAIVELAQLVINIEKRLARIPIPQPPLNPTGRYIRRSPSLPRRFD